MKNTMTTVLTILALLAAIPTAWAGDDANGAKARMSARLGTINALKQNQMIGEGNDGFLVVLKDTLAANEKAEVQQENADRKLVYAYIASKTGSTPQLVGERRAKKIGSASAPGTIYQDAAGNWVTK